MDDEKKESPFTVPLKKAEIVSRLSEKDLRNQNGEETEQKITIISDKGIQLERYSSDPGADQAKLIWKEKISEDPEITDDILDAIAQEFSDYVTNHGTPDNWYLTITDNDDRQFIWSGLSDQKGLSHLSDYIRDLLDDNSLFLFDGNPDRIDRIEIAYQRQTTIPVPPEWHMDHVIWDYHEQLIIDRSSETIEYSRFIAEETDICTRYHIVGGISDFLDDFDTDLFSRTEGNPPDVYENPMESSTYQIKLFTKNEGERDLSGSFDKKGLPMDFPDFMDDLSAFLDFYGHGEMFDDLAYNHIRRRQNELIFCRVEFENNGPAYWYLSDTDTCRPMDLVVVPAGEDNQKTVGRIVSIEYHTKDNAPYPVDQIKKIIRPYDEETDAHLNHTDL